MYKQNTGTVAGEQSWECNKGKFSPFYFPHICSGCISYQTCPHCPLGRSWLSIPSSFSSAFIHQPLTEPVLGVRHQARGWDTEMNGTTSLPSRISLASAEPGHRNQ